MTQRRTMADRADSDRPAVPSAVTGFSVAVKYERATAELTPAGDIDLATVERFQRTLDALIDAHFARILIDLRKLDFLDCPGLHALIRAQARAKQEGCELAIIPGPPAVQRVFELTGVLDRLPFVR
jgi:anti-anti-sigma factor